MIWRVERPRSLGAKARPRAVLELSAAELEELLEATVNGADPDRFTLEVDLRAAHSALLAQIFGHGRR